mgnify:CR=1 FL=1
MEFRVSALEERREFYKKEFSLEKVKSWFKGRKLPQLCAIDAGTDSKVLVDKKFKGNMFYFKFSELREKIKKYVPEDIYYHRSVYENPKKVLESLNFRSFKEQELAFDVDANNIKCKLHRKETACGVCIGKAFEWAKKLKAELEKDYKKVKLVYSGRGFHVHVFDKKANKLRIEEREELNRKFKNYPIDPWVSRGYIGLIRMPYTLNGMVSRIATPLADDKIDIKKTIPKFMMS